MSVDLAPCGRHLGFLCDVEAGGRGGVLACCPTHLPQPGLPGPPP